MLATKNLSLLDIVNILLRFKYCFPNFREFCFVWSSFSWNV